MPADKAIPIVATTAIRYLFMTISLLVVGTTHMSSLRVTCRRVVPMDCGIVAKYRDMPPRDISLQIGGGSRADYEDE